ncbi:FecR family protein [Pedobacter sp. L105]|uniref:FecR family protein n=1 Tax=Pedobacter sp. L105 TaxID=1641871 RepID=UPI00131B4DC2|nr:FecR domain-containing protein [Pedobacter sp. L105]
MDTSRERITYLFKLYAEHTATQQEIDELYKLVCESPDDEQLSMLLQDLWEDAATEKPLFSPEKTEEILNSILKVEAEQPLLTKKKASFSFLLKAAAAAILLMTGFFYFHQRNPALVVKTVKHSPKQDILPGGNHAILTLANGKTIKLDHIRNGVLVEHDGLQITKTGSGQLLYNLTAVTGKPDDAENMISTPKGGQYQILLSDGTKVWLNAASSLRFPVCFNQQSRKVELTGEAYFEVAKNPARPFIVKTANTSIKVFGTHFNVMAYPDESTSKTTLLEGSVSVSSATASDLIKPGEQALLNQDGKISIQKHINEREVMAWKNGNFSFEDTGIQEVMRQVARWYDVSVVYEGKIPTKRLTGTLSRNVNASTLFNMLSYTGINFRIEEKRIIVTN